MDRLSLFLNPLFFPQKNSFLNEIVLTKIVKIKINIQYFVIKIVNFLLTILLLGKI